MASEWRSPVGCTVSDVDIKHFRAWCRRNKVLWDKCEVSTSATTGRSVMASKTIEKGEVAVEVPDDAVLMSENSSISDQLAEYGLMKPAEDAIFEVQGLVLAVMYEQSLGLKSRWAPYLNFLPVSMDHMPMFWEAAELDELRGTAALDKMKGRVQHPADAPTRVEQLFEEVVLPFCQQYQSLTRTMMASTLANTSSSSQGQKEEEAEAEGEGGGRPADGRKRKTRSVNKGQGQGKGRKKSKVQEAVAGRGSKGATAEEELTEEAVREGLWPLYRWASAVVASYSFVLGDDHYQAMVPVWDALNHVTGKVNVKLYHEPDRGVLQMIATADIPQGAEVVNCYGQLSSSELLRGYGFVEKDNFNQHVQVPAQFLIKAAAAAGAGAAGSRQENGAKASAAEAAAAAAGTGPAGSRHENGAKASAGAAVAAAATGSGEGVRSEEDQDLSNEEAGGDSEEDESESELPEFDLEDDSEHEVDPQGRGGREVAEEDHLQGRLQQERTGGSGKRQEAGQRQAEGLSLCAAMDLMEESWGRAWLLAHQLKLLPKNGVFSIPSSGTPGPEMLALLQLLLLPAEVLQQLQRLVDRAGRRGDTSGGAGEDLRQLKWPEDTTTEAALLQLVSLMLGRYSCDLGVDEKKLGRLEQLPPREQAAVVARAAEKRCLHALRQAAAVGRAAGEGWKEQALAVMEKGIGAVGQARVKRKQAANCSEEQGEDGEEEEEEEEQEEEGGKDQGHHHHHQQQQQDGRGAHCCSGKRHHRGCARAEQQGDAGGDNKPHAGAADKQKVVDFSFNFSV